MMKLPGYVKAIAAAVALLALLLVAGGYLGQYRAVRNGSEGKETTSTAEATGTAKAATVTGSGKDVMTPSRTDGPAWVTVQIEGLNLRTKPKSDAEVIRGLERDERLTYVSGEPGWYQVVDKDGRTGWISSNPQYATLSK